MPFTQSHLVALARKPLPVTRKRVYGTGVLVLSVLSLWGFISADEAKAYGESFAELLSAISLFMARSNVSSS